MPRFVALNLCDVWFAGVKRNKLRPKDVNGKLVKFCVKLNVTGNKAHEFPFLPVYVTLRAFHENFFKMRFEIFIFHLQGSEILKSYSCWERYVPTVVKGQSFFFNYGK